jgi:hypothetical protein
MPCYSGYGWPEPKIGANGGGAKRNKKRAKMCRHSRRRNR